MEEQKITLNKNKILEWYIDDVLKEEKPKNVYAFAEKHGMTESEFYAFFSDISTIESYFFDALFEASIQTLNETEEYPLFSAKDKLLSFYYTFFENLKLNRSFVKYALGKQSLSDLKKLKGLRLLFLEFTHELGIEKFDLKQKDINKIQDKVVEESTWLHFLGTLKFWLNDDSANFEKTDMFIEKSVNAGFELMNVNALKCVADFGKFMFKEFNPSK